VKSGVGPQKEQFRVSLPEIGLLASRNAGSGESYRAQILPSASGRLEEGRELALRPIGPEPSEQSTDDRFHGRSVKGEVDIPSIGNVTASSVTKWRDRVVLERSQPKTDIRE
jgi:hypothetical protein